MATIFAIPSIPSKEQPLPSINTKKKKLNLIPNFASSPSPDKPECKKCIKALQELENIDDEADQLDIGFVKIHDEDLAEEYNLGPLPKLVYYRHQTPIVYERKCYALIA